jgi:hypothetical protein
VAHWQVLFQQNVKNENKTICRILSAPLIYFITLYFSLYGTPHIMFSRPFPGNHKHRQSLARQADCKPLASRLLQITGQPIAKSLASRLQITGKPIANHWQAKCKYPTTSEFNFSRVFYCEGFLHSACISNPAYLLMRLLIPGVSFHKESLRK